MNRSLEVVERDYGVALLFFYSFRSRSSFVLFVLFGRSEWERRLSRFFSCRVFRVFWVTRFFIVVGFFGFGFTVERRVSRGGNFSFFFEDFRS